MESLRSSVICYDGEYIWAVDDIVGGLYVINVINMQVSCEISPIQLYKYDSFGAASIVKKNDFLIIVPRALKQRWVFYDIKKKTVTYRKIIEIDACTEVVQVIGDLAYIPPAGSKDPFIVFNMNEMRPCAIIKDFYIENSDFSIWRTFKVGDMCYVPLRGTRVIYGISAFMNEWIEIGIAEKIGDVDGLNEEYWVLPLKGKYIYCVDCKGNVIKKIELVVSGKEELDAGDFVRIIVTDTCVFLLPWLDGDIYVYEKNKHKLSKIKSQNFDLSNDIFYDIDEIPYWGYLMNKKEICFFQRLRKLMVVKYDDFEVQQRKLMLPDRNDYELIHQWIRLPRKDNIFIEMDKESSLLAYLNYIKNCNMDYLSPNLEIGKKIYNHLVNL